MGALFRPLYSHTRLACARKVKRHDAGRSCNSARIVSLWRIESHFRPIRPQWLELCMSIDTRVARYEVEVLQDVRIPTFDPQVTLSADIYRPITNDRVPALVMVLPYRKDMGAFLDALPRWFAERGYCHVVVDLRGTGSSDGGQRPKFDPGEGDDAIAAIEWAAAQSWCSGNVGMWGTSSGGFITLRAASQRPPHLKAIIPIVCPLDPERAAVHPDGARNDLHQLAIWGGMMLLQQLMPPLLNCASESEQHRWRQRLYDTEPFIFDLARWGPGDPVWRERAVDPKLISVPTLCVGGWRDPYVDGAIQAYEHVQGPKKLLIGPWMHSWPQDSPYESIDFLSIALRWWDHWLYGFENGVMDEPPVVLNVQGERSCWRGYHCWSPASDELTLGTKVGTVLVPRSGGDSQRMELIAEYYPDCTIGALSGLWGIPTSGFGWPLDQHDDDSRALSATGDPLTADLLICGSPEVTVMLARNGYAGREVERIVVRLAEVDPFGRSTLITAGVVCPGKPSDIHRVVLRPTACRIRKGNRLRVVISDSDFPRLRPLLDPCILGVTGIDLSVPTVLADAGVALDMPTLPRGESATLDGRWTITRDPIRDSLEIGIGWSTPLARTSQGHTFETHMDTRSTVRRMHPEAAVITGDHVAKLRLANGEEITVAVSVRCSQHSLWVRGEVINDGVTTFCRTWESVLPGGEGDGRVSSLPRPSGVRRPGGHFG